MGDPKKHRKKYAVPKHPWNKERLDVESELRTEYGLKNKKEIYKIDSFLRRIKSETKRLTSSHSKQAATEMEQLASRLKKYNLLSESANVDTILGLELKNVMDRRLQSIVYKKGLANSPKQARQFITHEHIIVGDKKVTSPNYLVSVTEESNVSFEPSSPIADTQHPERLAATKDIKKEIEKTKPKKDTPVDEDLDVPKDLGLPEDKEVEIPDEEAKEIEEEGKGEEKAEKTPETETKEESPSEKNPEETQSSEAASAEAKPQEKGSEKE